jgi:hypothetical protein
MQSVTVIGCIIGIFVLLNGIYVVTFPPLGDELQGIALIAIAIFIILSSLHMGRSSERPE